MHEALASEVIIAYNSKGKKGAEFLFFTHIFPPIAISMEVIYLWN